MIIFRITRPDIRSLAALRTIELAAAARFPPGFLPETVHGDCLSFEVLSDALADGRLFVAVVDDEESPVGFACYDEKDGLPLLKELDVLPEFGRRGIGRSLVAAVAEEARRRGWPYLHLTTFSNIPWNAPFYEKIGFVPVPPREITPALRGILDRERAAGLRNRVAMRLNLQTSRTEFSSSP